MMLVLTILFKNQWDLSHIRGCERENFFEVEKKNFFLFFELHNSCKKRKRIEFFMSGTVITHYTHILSLFRLSSFIRKTLNTTGIGKIDIFVDSSALFDPRITKLSSEIKKPSSKNELVRRRKAGASRKSIEV